MADVGEVLASGKGKWHDLVIAPLVASKDSVIAWLDKVTKASDASQKATEDEEALPDNIDQQKDGNIIHGMEFNEQFLSIFLSASLAC